jgi:hypothetical protein
MHVVKLAFSMCVGLIFLCACWSTNYGRVPKLTSVECAALALPRLVPAEVREREPKEGQTVDAQFWRFAIIVRPPDPGIPMIKYFGIDALRYVNFKSIFSFDGFCELKPGRRRATQFSFDSSFIHNIPN